MEKSFFKDWNLSRLAMAYAVLGLRPPTEKGIGNYWRKLGKPTKEQQAATIAACEAKQYQKASKRLACYSRSVFNQPIKHRYFLDQIDSLLPF